MTTYMTREQFLLTPTSYLFAAALAGLAMLYPGELAGWLIIIISYLLITGSRTTHDNPVLFNYLFVIITVRHAISLLNIYGVTIISASLDARTFHSLAAQEAALSGFFDWSSVVQGIEFYIVFLSKLYMLFGSHILVGQSASVLALLGFCLLTYRIALLIGMKRESASGVTLLIGLVPSMIMYTAVTMREPWKLFFLAIFVEASLLFYYDSKSGFNLVKIILTSVLLALFHRGFVVLAPWLLILPLLLSVLSSEQKIKRPVFRVLLSIVCLVALVFTLSLVSPHKSQGVTQSADTGEMIESAARYRQGGMSIEGRTSYGIALDSSSVVGLMTTVPLIYLYFLAAPFPWQIQKLIDVYGFIDVLIGLVFLFGALKWYKQCNNKQQRIKLRYLLTVFFLVSIIHALGTVNYGTAIRHRLLTSWLAILMGWAVVIPWVQKRVRFGR